MRTWEYNSYPHHDGSELYLSNPTPKLSEIVEFRVRTPKHFDISQMILRLYQDGEKRMFPMQIMKPSPTCYKDENEQWWSVKVQILNPINKYRFLMVSPDKYCWLTAAGVIEHNPNSFTDFCILTDRSSLNWLSDRVLYQIFPDRFAKSNHRYKLPKWVVPKAWDELPNYKSNLVSQEYYGGDFYGVAEKIDYLKDLGVNGIYFTPFFPATSTHRYDATTFKKVDPLLGGDLALGNLIKKLHRNSIKIIGDLTTNHTGDQHQWFRAAVTNKASKYRKYYYFDKKLKLGYAAWWGVKSLPKLNFNSLPLRNDLFAGKNSIVKSWLRFGLDGWRIDVGNMSGKYLADDRQKEVSTGIRNSMKAENPKAWLVAENADWNLEDLSGESWQGSMNYEGFMRPLWAWLGNNKNLGIGFHGDPIAPPKFSGTQLVKSMQAFSSGVPWQSFINSMTLLDSHDTARFKTVVSENLNLHLVGLSLLLTYPGIPSLLAGDEIGLTGVTGEDSRRTMPWDNPEKWDWELHENVKKLIAIRKEHLALTIGGIRWIKVEADQIAFLRESANQGILVELWREGGEFNLLKELSDLARFAKGATVLFETKGEKPAPGSRVTLLY